MENFKPPGELKIVGGNLADRWERFIEQFRWYLEAIDAQNAGDRRKVAILLTVAGKEAQEVFRTFTYAPAIPEIPAQGNIAAVPEVPAETAEQFDTVVRKFQEFCVPRKNIIYERYVFHTRQQQEEESIDSFVTDLRLKAQSCEFGELQESLIRDRLVVGIGDAKLKEKLLKDPNLTLERAIELCKISEAAHIQMKVLTQGQGDGFGKPNSTGESNVNVVKNPSVSQKSKTAKTPASTNDSSSAQTPDSNKKGKKKICRRCGTFHKYRQCPAWGQTCKRCGGPNHFAEVCKSRSVQVVGVDQSDSEEEESEFYVNAINGEERCEWMAALTVNNCLLTLKIDSGAQVNILNFKDYQGLSPKPRILARKPKLKSYNDDPIEVMGTCRVQVCVKNKTYQVQFVVVPADSPSLLGAHDSERLGLVNRANLVKKVFAVTEEWDVKVEYKEVFQGLGCLDGKCRIHLREDAVPVVYPARKVPLALKSKLQDELKRLEKLGVIKKTNIPTDWVLPLVLVEKANGDIRVCVDPMTLNIYIKREHYHLPHKSEILSEMAGAKFFSKLDAAQGFYQIQLDEPSSQLCTVATPFGRYSFQRLPFGVSCAPEMFHAKVQQLFDKEQGVKVFVDDIVVWGKTMEEHNVRLKRVMEIIKASGMKLNEKKCTFGATEITYLGEKLTSLGVKPDPEKVAAINKMPIPENKEDLQRVLGMVNYLSKFVPNLSVKTKALRGLLQSQVEWIWEDDHSQEWENIKEILTQEPLLKFYDPKRRTKVSSDASKDGLGAVLLQEHEGKWLPVAFASRAMSKAERNYAQIEKELLGILVACEKFHEFIYGTSVVVETDHKPLISLHRKNLNDLTPRLQRLMLRLRRYDLHLEYIPGKFLIVADTLSRAVNPEARPQEVESSLHVEVIKKTYSVSDPMWEKIKLHTLKDTEFQVIMRAVHRGWDDSEARALKPYYHFRALIAEVDGVLVKGSKILIPSALRKEMLEKIHEGHMGIEKCQSRAREVMYWPNMGQDIENKVNCCSICQKHRYRQPREPLIQHEIPCEPWVKIGADLFTLGGKNFLVVIDYTSNYPEVAELEELSAACTINHMKDIIARHGLPRTVITDNGPQFACREFAGFAKEYGFDHVSSSPEYPQSNGRAEKAVQIVKRLLKKAKEADADPYLALLSYRATPLGGDKSPGEICMHRKLRTKLPSVEEHMKIGKTMDAKPETKRYYDRGTRVLEPLDPFDTVRMQTKGVWAEKAMVQQQVAPNSYAIQTESGKCFRRNRKHLLKTQEGYRPEVVVPEAETEMCTERGASNHSSMTSTENSRPIGSPQQASNSEGASGMVNSSPVKAPMTTKSGRVVKKPSRFL
jgi:hypothetical protein